MPLPPDLSKPIFTLMPHLADRILCGKCAFCAEPLGEFTDELSKREYGISGMCQSCQDKTFGVLEEDNTFGMLEEE